MSIEEAIMGGIVFKGKKDKPKEEEKVKTKAKKATYNLWSICCTYVAGCFSNSENGTLVDASLQDNKIV